MKDNVEGIDILSDHVCAILLVTADTLEQTKGDIPPMLKAQVQRLSE